MAAPTPRPEADSAKEVDSFLSQVLSIRVILVCITILTVISMGIGLIVVRYWLLLPLPCPLYFLLYTVSSSSPSSIPLTLFSSFSSLSSLPYTSPCLPLPHISLHSVHAQMDIVDDLSARIQQDVSTQIEYKMTDIFKYVEDELDASITLSFLPLVFYLLIFPSFFLFLSVIGRLLYQTSGIEYPPTMGENPFEVWPTISEHLWSIVRKVVTHIFLSSLLPPLILSFSFAIHINLFLWKRPEGLEVEFEFFDGRFFGMESYSSQADICIHIHVSSLPIHLLSQFQF